MDKVGAAPASIEKLKAESELDNLASELDNTEAESPVGIDLVLEIASDIDVSVRLTEA